MVRLRLLTFADEPFFVQSGRSVVSASWMPYRIMITNLTAFAHGIALVQALAKKFQRFGQICRDYLTKESQPLTLG
jgi:hypothetical protein